MKHFRGLFVVFLCVLASTAYSTLPTPCSELIIRSHPTASTGAKITDAVPKYDALQDMMFFFHGGHHASLYVGNYYWDHWGYGSNAKITVHHQPRVIPKGVAVRVRIGASRVQALEATISQARTPIAHTTSCHLNQLAFLQLHKIFLRGGPKLLGTSTLRSVLEDGFVDESGATLPTEEIITIEGPDQHLSHQLRTNLYYYPLDNVVLFLGMFGLNQNQILSEVLAHAPASQAAEVVQTIRKGGREALSAEQQHLLNQFAQALESKLLQLTQAHFNTSLYPLLELLAYQPQSVPKEDLRNLLKQAIRECF